MTRKSTASLRLVFCLALGLVLCDCDDDESALGSCTAGDLNVVFYADFVPLIYRHDN